MGLGCYIKEGWGATAESAEQRLCMAMNMSVGEIDLYALLQDHGPADFWIGPLERYAAGLIVARHAGEQCKMRRHG